MTMNVEFLYRKKIQVGILGATGLVGQKFVQLLSKHPWFKIEALAASENSAGKTYGEAVDWKGSEPLDPEVKEMVVESTEGPFDCSILFSALDASVAGELEARYAEEGYTVISNSRNHRMDPDVPLLIPEVNPDHLQLLARQKNRRKGVIVTNPNCVVIPLSIALKPLDALFHVKEVQVTTMQAISGAGNKPELKEQVDDNVIPYIEGEEEKIETEPKKVLGYLEGEMLLPWEGKISAQCNRVAVQDGHLLNVSVKLEREAELQDVIDAWQLFKGEPQFLKLPLAPLHPIQYFVDVDSPQPKIHRELEKGMVVCLGRLRKCSINHFKFVILSNNTIRGAAGTAIENAELMVRRGDIFW